MEKVFLDTNILLDVLFEREGYQSSLEILQMGDEGKLCLCTSVLSMANIAYLLRKSFSYGSLVATLAQLTSLVQVLPMDGDQFKEALFLNGPDLEDVLQIVCAMKNGCSALITHNSRVFKITSGLMGEVTIPPVMTPEEAVTFYTGEAR